MPAVRCAPPRFRDERTAAAVCLERPESDRAAEAYTRIDRYSLAGDATHMTANDPNATALRKVIRTIVAGRHVDLIHAHGTGTVLNDATELDACDDECRFDDGSPPIIYSHKARSATAWSLGASSQSS